MSKSRPTSIALLTSRLAQRGEGCLIQVKPVTIKGAHRFRAVVIDEYLEDKPIKYTRPHSGARTAAYEALAYINYRYGIGEPVRFEGVKL